MPSPYSGKVFPFDHNWTDPVVERIAWLTSVLRKRDGSEQRIRLRNQPRRTFEYTALIGGQDDLDMRRRFDALLWSGQDLEIMVPFWPDAQTLPTDHSAGASFLNMGLTFDLTGLDIDNSECYLMLWKDYRTYEVVKFTEATFFVPGAGEGWHLNLATNLVNSWPAGTVVVPARRCLHSPSLGSEVHASDIKSVKATFQVIIPTTGAVTQYRATTPTADTYRSTDVLADPGMDGNNTSTLERVMTPIDFQVGQFSNDSFQTAPFGSIDLNIDLSSRAEIAPFLGWLNLRQGRQKAFWLPTWEKDFENVERTSDTTFAADSFGYSSTYDATESRRDIAFIDTDESMTYRRIVDSMEDDDVDDFEVDSDLPDPLTPERTSFLRYCRLDQDEVQMNWLTSDDVITSLKARELIKTA